MIGVLRAAMSDQPIDEAVDVVLAVWHARVADGEMSPQTAEKFLLLMRRFGRFAAATGVTSVDEVDGHVVEKFIHASGADRRGHLAAPATATQHQRRSVLRLFARDAIRLGFMLGDPTYGIELPRRSLVDVRPVNNDEVALLQCFAESWSTPTRHAATVALALAGVHTGEIARVAVDALRGDRVAAPGATRIAARDLPLSAWAQRVLAERAQLLAVRGKVTGIASLVSTGYGSAAQEQARVCTTIRDVIKRAGLGGEQDIRPSSLTAHAAAAAFDESQQIDAAAKVLGYQSLDTTARLIGWDWQART